MFLEYRATRGGWLRGEGLSDALKGSRDRKFPGESKVSQRPGKEGRRVS